MCASLSLSLLLLLLTQCLYVPHTHINTAKQKTVSLLCPQTPSLFHSTTFIHLWVRLISFSSLSSVESHGLCLCVVCTAAGIGFGLCHTILMYGSVLGNALGPGTLFSPHCPQMSTFVLTGMCLPSFDAPPPQFCSDSPYLCVCVQRSMPACFRCYTCVG